MTSDSMTPTPDRLGERIREARLRAGTSQERLARKLEIATRTVIRWEQRGSALMSLDQIQAVADALGVDFSDLVPDCEPGGAAA